MIISALLNTVPFAKLISNFNVHHYYRLLIKTVTILFKVVYAIDALKQQKSFYKHEHYALAYRFIWVI